MQAILSHLPDPHTQPQFYASVPTKRLFAWVVDFLMVAILCVIIVPFTAFTGVFFFPLLMLVVGFAYRVITLANSASTWGMRLMAIELRTANGARPDLAAAFLHTLGYSVSMAFPILQVISIVLMLTSSRGQGLTDHVMGTVMINRRG